MFLRKIVSVRLYLQITDVRDGYSGTSHDRRRGKEERSGLGRTDNKTTDATRFRAVTVQSTRDLL